VQPRLLFSDESELWRSASGCTARGAMVSQRRNSSRRRPAQPQLHHHLSVTTSGMTAPAITCRTGGASTPLCQRARMSTSHLKGRLIAPPVLLYYPSPT
jgi:hypothetical protein